MWCTFFVKIAKSHGFVTHGGGVWMRPILPSVNASEHIFYFEALAVCLTFYYFANQLQNLSCNCLVIYTDSSNTVDVFNSL